MANTGDIGKLTARTDSRRPFVAPLYEILRALGVATKPHPQTPVETDVAAAPTRSEQAA